MRIQMPVTWRSSVTSVLSDSCDSDEDDGGGCGWMEEVDTN